MPRLLSLATVPGKFRSRRSIKRFLILSSWIFLIHELFTLLTQHHSSLPFASPSRGPILDYIRPPHPIRNRLDTARHRWTKRLEAQSTNYRVFKNTYRSRYGLEPPDGMREWFRIVTADGVLLVDEFDELMSSLEPFRTMDPDELIRRTLEVATMPTFSLLNLTEHHASFSGQNYRGDGAKYSRENYGPGIERVEGLAAMLQRHIGLVPDGTIFAVSELAEPRVIVPWQDHPDTLLSFETAMNSPGSDHLLQSRSLSDPGPGGQLKAHRLAHGGLTQYDRRLPRPDLAELLPTPNFRGSGSSWELYAKSCPPESAARKKLSSLKGDSTIKKPGPLPAGPATNDSHTLVQGRAKSGQTKRRAMTDMAEDSKKKIATEPPESSVILTGNETMSLVDELMDLPQAMESNEIVGQFATAEELIKTSKQFNFVELGYRGLKHAALCEDSELHQIQGAFFSDWRGLQALYPVFSPSKIDGYSDILIPSNFYYGDDARYSFETNETIEWDDKHDKLFWRGKTTGGGNSPPRHQLQYQRHRFVRLAQSLSRSMKSLLVQRDGSGLIYHVKRAVGDLNQAWLDVGFTGYTGCGDPDICDLTAALYPLKAPVPLREMARYKAILDLDGMAFSGRFVALMSMGSGVVKSTIFKDALTDWIEPWVHYIPLSVGYDELYNLMSYFLPLPDEDVVDSSSGLHRRTRSAGEKMKRWWNRLRGKGDGTGGGNEELRKVAEDGLKWSETVGNKPDIEAYVLRLALEWARLLGKIGDEEIQEGEEPEIVEQEPEEPIVVQITSQDDGNGNEELKK